MNKRETQLPDLFKKQMKSLLNEDEWQAFILSQDDDAPVSIRLHPEKESNYLELKNQFPGSH
ncbi:MAG: hypothetical protein IPI60_05880 [Saprospiraceae bacterium]|nr:hypothetical protein [Saprospiraceae bacterium]